MAYLLVYDLRTYCEGYLLSYLLFEPLKFDSYKPGRLACLHLKPLWLLFGLFTIIACLQIADIAVIIHPKLAHNIFLLKKPYWRVKIHYILFIKDWRDPVYIIQYKDLICLLKNRSRYYDGKVYYWNHHLGGLFVEDNIW